MHKLPIFARACAHGLRPVTCGLCIRPVHAITHIAISGISALNLPQLDHTARAYIPDAWLCTNEYF
jgi:hypothetical protein